MKKILTVLGARPQFIKSAVISRKIRQEYSRKLEEIIIHTGQHYDRNMSDIFFKEMQIPNPDYFLRVKKTGHGRMSGEMMIKLEDIIIRESPDLVFVYGDTNTTLAGALVAGKLNIPVAHIEAGLRSFNKKMPEEINRIVSDHISRYLFCASNESKKNLNLENIKEGIHVVGDIMYEATCHYRKKIKASSKFKDSIPNSFYLATIHRQENTHQKELINIFESFKILSKDTTVVLPLHPRTRKYLTEYKIQISDKIHILDPIGYFEMMYLLENCKLVLTDSGGLQKEAYYF